MVALIPFAEAPAELRAQALTLNNADAERMSWLEAEDLDRLASLSYLASIAEEGSGLMIVIGPDELYDSRNYRWISDWAARERTGAVVYVDRVVVAEAARGRGVARGMYEALFRQAMIDGFAAVCCEVNVVPANPASHAFHEALGFTTIADISYDDGAKVVRYYQRLL